MLALSRIISGIVFWNLFTLTPSMRPRGFHIILCAYYTPCKLHVMGLLDSAICCKCHCDRGSLIHMLWCCPKLHRYWTKVVDTVNTVFQVALPLDHKTGLLGILDDPN